MPVPYGKMRFQAILNQNGTAKFLSGATIYVYAGRSDRKESVNAGGDVLNGSTLATIYSNESGMATTNPLVADINGQIEFYAEAGLYDFRVAAVDGSTYGSSKNPHYGEPVPIVVDVRDYATFQDAINATPSGGTLFIPAGLYTRLTAPAVVPMTITKCIHIKGESFSNKGVASGSRIVYQNFATEDLVSDLITITGHDADSTIIENLYIEGAGASGIGRGVVVKDVSNVLIDHCLLYGFPSWALASDGTTDIVVLTIQNSVLQRSFSNGLIKFGGASTEVVWFSKIFNCNFVPNAGRIIEIRAAFGTQIEHCTLEADIDPASANGDTGAYIYIESVIGGGNYHLYGTRICNNWFESVTATNPPNNWFIYLKGGTANTTILNNHFARANATPASLRAIKTETIAGPGAAFRLIIENNYGLLGGATTVGTDDILLGLNCSGHLANNMLADGVKFTNSWRVSAADATWLEFTRAMDNFRLKLPGLSTAARDVLTDVKDGDIILNTTIPAIQARVAGAWVNL